MSCFNFLIVVVVVVVVVVFDRKNYFAAQKRERFGDIFKKIS